MTTEIRGQRFKQGGFVSCTECLPLTMAAPGERLTLVDITAKNGLRHRLTELGLTPGVEFQVLQSQGGPLLLAIHDSRLAVGREMAQQIWVKIRERNYD